MLQIKTPLKIIIFETIIKQKIQGGIIINSSYLWEGNYVVTFSLLQCFWKQTKGKTSILQ